jgi:hypothetical protein
MRHLVRVVLLSRLRRTTRTSGRICPLLPPDDGLLSILETCRGVVTE